MNSQSLTISVFVGFAVVGDAEEGLDVSIIVGRALVGARVGDRVGLVVEGILLVGTDEIGFAVVGNTDGLDVFVIVGRALVGIAVGDRVGLLVEGTLVGLHFGVGTEVGFAVVVGYNDGFDDPIVGRALVGKLVDGPLVGLLEFLVGTDVVGLKVCNAVGAAVGPAVLG